MRFFVPRILVVFAIAGLLLGLAWLPAWADSPIIGEIRIYSLQTPPPNYINADGSCPFIAMYPDLYAVITTTYGSLPLRFCLPNLSGKFPLGANSTYPIGTIGGEISHTLTITETAYHRHELKRSVNTALAYGTSYGMPGQNSGGEVASGYTQYTGGDGAHNNMPPYLAVNFIIAYTTTLITPTPTTTATATPTPTPTATSTPTATPIPTPTTSAYTHTLGSGNTVYLPLTINAGELIAAFIGLTIGLTLLVLVLIRVTK